MPERRIEKWTIIKIGAECENYAESALRGANRANQTVQKKDTLCLIFQQREHFFKLVNDQHDFGVWIGRQNLFD